MYDYTLVHTEIDEEEGLIRRTFNAELPCVSGQINPYAQSNLQITEAYNREIYWLKKLNGSKFIPKLIDYDTEKQTIIQTYYEPSCLISNKIPTKSEIVDMYLYFKEMNLNKLNGSLSNMSYNGNQLIAFDFKYCCERPTYTEREFKSYDMWLSKIDKDLPEILKDIYND